MVNYKDSIIYKIVCNDTGKTYYGSTCKPQLCNRMTQHRANYKKYLEGKTNYTTSFSILEGGNYGYSLVEEYPCDSKQQLHARERYYIENNDCVNKVVPGRSRKEFYAAHKEQIKAYYEDNKEHIKEQQKSYNDAHKEQRKSYNDANKEHIKELHKQIVKCPCGCEIQKYYLTRHQKTKKHKKLMEAKCES